jgi:hypothetical protein
MARHMPWARVILSHEWPITSSFPCLIADARNAEFVPAYVHTAYTCIALRGSVWSQGEVDVVQFRFLTTFNEVLRNLLRSDKNQPARRYSICRMITSWISRTFTILSPWLQIRRCGFDSRHYQKKKVVGLEWGPLSLVSTTEELLDRKVAGSCPENREYGRKDPSPWPRGTLYPQK